MKADSNSLSFVVQGPIINNPERSIGISTTQEVLLSIRKNFPTAEIILSTWQEEETKELIYDKLVLSKDPGVVGDIYKLNVNRLIVSSTNGVKVASNDMVVKTRTDIIFSNNNLLKSHKVIKSISGKFTLFSAKVATLNLYTRDPVKSGYLYHPSDIIVFGRKEDVLAFFNQKLAVKSDIEQLEKNGLDISYVLKQVIEQYIFTELIRKRLSYQIYFEKFSGYLGLKDFWLCEKLLFNNFKIYTPDDLGVIFPQKLYLSQPESTYSTKNFKLCFILNSFFLTDIFYCKVFRGLKYFLKFSNKSIWSFPVKLVFDRSHNLLTKNP